jgi:S1-C subfamily serine protease
MFAEAWERAARNTRHVATCARYADGSLRAGGATFFALGATGWVVTAGHVFTPPLRRGEEPVRFERWWGSDGVVEAEVHVYADVDLAICRLEPGPHSECPPRFAPARAQRLGTSLLTLGYPYECGSTIGFDENSSAFRFEAVTRGLYGVEGMLARILDAGASEKRYTRRFLETSAVPRAGQSGGPTVDSAGVVWGIQVRTHHEPLGYSVRVDLAPRIVTEHQVANTAIAVQSSTLAVLFDRHDIKVEWV